MGRSGGGGFSGGGSSGGFSGGGRSSGGFSGGGGRSGGGRSGGFGGGSGGGRPMGGPGAGRPMGRPSGGFFPMPIFIHTSSSGSSGGQDPRRSGNSAEHGCVKATVIIAVVVLSLCILASLFTVVRSAGSTSSITASTVEREALPASAVVETGYYTDADGSWILSSSTLESGMRTFYQKTGVQPYLYILPNGTTTSTSELTALAEELYDELFEDEAHFLLVFCDDGYGSYNCGYEMGSQAKTIMDDEAIEILGDYLDRYYEDLSISEEEIFSNTFADTANRIMSVTRSPLVPIAICAAVVVVAVLAFIAFRKYREHKAREREHAERILNTPLETFGDLEVDELEKKYTQQSSAQDSTAQQSSAQASVVQEAAAQASASTQEGAAQASVQDSSE